MPIQFWKKATCGVAIAAAATAGPGIAQALAAPIPAPVTMIGVPCHGPALNTAIATAPPDSVLALAPGCFYRLTHGLPAISDMIELRGPATITLRPQATAGSILTVAAGGDVTTDHVSFAGGDAVGNRGQGGAINNDGGTVQVNFGRFSHNRASTDGGAIYNGGGLLTVFRASFSSNTAAGFGGAIENDGAARIRSSAFHGNTAYSGGGVYNKSGTLTVQDSRFTGNQAAFDPATVPRKDTAKPPSGAGVASEARMTLTGDSFDGNGSGTTFRGGGVDNDGRATVTGTTISDNRAVAGGGFYNDATAAVTRGTIWANSTAHDGGGIYNSGWLTVSATKFLWNHAGLDGGGLLNGGIAKVSGSQFYYNFAGVGGGGIHDYYVLKLTKTVLRDNTPDNCLSRRGAKSCAR